MTHYYTTPIYYVNDQPHIGHAYTTVVADVLTRYRKLFNEEVFFLTGTDEHGQKVQNAAQKRGMTPQAHCDDMVQNFKKIWQELQIQPDFFIRTTMDFHKKEVQKHLQTLFDSGDIYLKEYEGWYSESEEIFYTEKDLVNGKTPAGKEVQQVKEKNYFFKMSSYQTRLIDYIKTNSQFIQPESKRNEMLGFLQAPLNDLCISRPKARLSWGIELPFDKDFVTYVWFDALINYVSALKEQSPNHYEKYWPVATHILGKDILMTHAIYWPTMLMALKIPLPQLIFAHGWWLIDGEKMSKSAGAVVKPLDMKNLVGVDGLRYFLTRDIHFGNDAQFSADLVIARVNAELANNLGNLLSRTTNLISKYFDGKIKSFELTLTESKDLSKMALLTGGLVKEKIDKMAPNLAVGHVVDLLNAANKYLEVYAPWKSAKENLDQAGENLYVVAEVLRIAGILLSPVMPQKTADLLRSVGWTKTPALKDAAEWGLLKTGTAIEKTAPLFPRVDVKA